MKRGDRQHDERRVYARRQARTPGYHQRHAGKTPGKVCSCENCGNPRRHYGDVTMQERRAMHDSPHDWERDVVHPAELARGYLDGTCPHGAECGYCDEWSCVTGEPESVTTPPLRAPCHAR